MKIVKVTHVTVLVHWKMAELISAASDNDTDESANEESCLNNKDDWLATINDCDKWFSVPAFLAVRCQNPDTGKQVPDIANYLQPEFHVAG